MMNPKLYLMYYTVRFGLDDDIWKCEVNKDLMTFSTVAVHTNHEKYTLITDQRRWADHFLE